MELLRQGRAEEATRDSSRIARAIAFHVQELSEPQEVLEAADRLWKGYPFSIADLEIDIDLLERVAEKEAESRAKIEPPTPRCSNPSRLDDFPISKAPDFVPVERHPPDGGRCARWAYRILRDQARSLKNPDYREFEKLKDFLSFMVESYGSDVFVLLAGLRIEQVGRLAGSTRREAFASQNLLRTRWNRLLRGHLAWLRANLFRWESDWTEFDDAGTSLRGSGPELDHLAIALENFHTHFSNCKREKDVRALLDRAVAEIEAAAPGSPFPRAARLGQIEAWLVLDRAREALAEFRRRPSGDPEEAPRILIWIAMTLESKEDRGGAKALLEETLSTYGAYASAMIARVHLARILLEEGAEGVAMAHLEAVFRSPSLPQMELDDESPDYARSEATRMLAALYEEGGQWKRSFVLWSEWVPATFCGTCAREMEDGRHFHLGLALENLERAKEAAGEYWLSAPSHEEAARRCRALHARLGTLGDFKRQVEEAIQRAKQHDPELSGFAGLRWLKENLKSP